MGSIVDDSFHPGLSGAMGAAVYFTALPLGPVSEDTATASTADGCESVSGALEGIKMIGGSVHRDLERISIGVSAAVTCFHN